MKKLSFAIAIVAMIALVGASSAALEKNNSTAINPAPELVTGWHPNFAATQTVSGLPITSNQGVWYVPPTKCFAASRFPTLAEQGNGGENPLRSVSVQMILDGAYKPWANGAR
jgi:hypothetical protein